MKKRSVFRSILALTLSLSLSVLQPAAAIADTLIKDPERIEGTRFTKDQLIDGKWYYFSEAEGSGTMGAMLRDTITPDGYYVGPDGVWVPETAAG